MCVWVCMYVCTCRNLPPSTPNSNLLEGWCPFGTAIHQGSELKQERTAKTCMFRAQFVMSDEIGQPPAISHTITDHGVKKWALRPSRLNAKSIHGRKIWKFGAPTAGNQTWQWKIPYGPMNGCFSRKITDTWSIFGCHVWTPEGNTFHWVINIFPTSRTSQNTPFSDRTYWDV